MYGFCEGAGSVNAGPHLFDASIFLLCHSPDPIHRAFYKFVAPNEPLVELASDYVLLSLSWVRWEIKCKTIIPDIR